MKTYKGTHRALTPPLTRMISASKEIARQRLFALRWTGLISALLLTQAMAPKSVSIGVGAANVPKSLPIGACINLGNHLSSGMPGEHPGKKLTNADLVNIRAAGFTTVRFPVNFDRQSDTKPPYTVNPAWMTRVTQIVNQALNNRLNVILDFHNYESLGDGPTPNKARLAGIWLQIAKNFVNISDSHLWFEVLNEPHKPLTNDNLLILISPALQAIRSVSQTRPIIIGGGNASKVDSLATMPLPNDPHVYPTFHYYEPYAFTHQGNDWQKDGKVPPVGRAYGKPGDAAILARDVAQVENYIRQTQRIPFVGEVGAYQAAPLAQRVAYVGAMHRAFSQLNVPQCWYAYTNQMPFYDYRTGRWLPGMLEAIGLHDPGPRPIEQDAIIPPIR